MQPFYGQRTTTNERTGPIICTVIYYYDDSAAGRRLKLVKCDNRAKQALGMGWDAGNGRHKITETEGEVDRPTDHPLGKITKSVLWYFTPTKDRMNMKCSSADARHSDLFWSLTVLFKSFICRDPLWRPIPLSSFPSATAHTSNIYFFTRSPPPAPVIKHRPNNCIRYNETLTIVGVIQHWCHS